MDAGSRGQRSIERGRDAATPLPNDNSKTMIMHKEANLEFALIKITSAIAANWLQSSLTLTWVAGI